MIETEGAQSNQLPPGCSVFSEYYPPSSKLAALERYLAATDAEIVTPLEVESTCPFSKKERLVMEFAKDQTITTKQADKTQSLVIMNTSDYIEEAHSARHLGDEATYRKIEGSAEELLEKLKTGVHHFLFSSLGTLNAADVAENDLLTGTLKDADFSGWPKGKTFLKSLFGGGRPLGVVVLKSKAA